MAEQRHQAAVVEFDHVTKRYDAPTGRRKAESTPGAVNDLSMKVPAGQIC
jgi:ABC-type glutathione transport system ATPase component